MKSNEKKRAFIKARAEGKSYAIISKELSISKSTCTAWNSELRDDIANLQDKETEELYTAYNMQRKARIKDLGETLKRIDTAIEKKDLSELPAEKLLDLKLKYTEALKAEYIEPIEEPDNTLDGLLEEYNKLLLATQNGTMAPATAKAQLTILQARREAYREIKEEEEKERDGVIKPAFDFEIGDFEEYTSDLLRHPE